MQRTPLRRRGVLAGAITVVALLATVTVAESAAAVRPDVDAPGRAAIARLVPTDPVIMAAGDIACNTDSTSYNGGNGTATACRELATSDLLATPGIAAVLTLGDNQYYYGALSQYQASYDATWGRFRAITHPTPGNHEYYTPGATGYYSYFGAAAGAPDAGYYSYDVGTWHLIALNSNCAAVGGCGSTSPQGKWLMSDLTAHPNQCLLAYWHHPLFSSGAEPLTTAVRPLWVQLYAAGAEVVLNGHDHDYERFAPQDPYGDPAPSRGIREFVVGTGGYSHGLMPGAAAANEIVRFNDTFGVLRLVLHPRTYDWTFVAADGTTGRDSGSAACHVVVPTLVAPAHVVDATHLTLTGTARADAPVTLHISGPGGAQPARTVIAGADGSFRLTVPVGLGTYTSLATSGPFHSATMTTTVSGTTITGPAMARSGTVITLSGRAAPGRTVEVFVERPGHAPTGLATRAGSTGRYAVRLRLRATVVWWAWSAGFRSAKGRTAAV